MLGSIQLIAESSTASSNKRKPYSSCDTCKLRRVKCERDSEDEPCAKCLEKGVHCTTAGPKRKKQRTGKRIEQAKELFGDQTVSALSLSNFEAGFPISGGGLDELLEPRLSNASPENELSLSELIGQLSSHLIEVYFTMTNYPLPLYHWKGFREQFEQAGRRPEQMASPLTEVMAHTLIAWGARVSNAPAILGPGAPEISSIDAVEADLIHWGRRRGALCETLTDRAVSLADEKGVFRIESNESIVCLLLLEMLVDHGDVSRRKGRPFRVAAIGHARTVAEESSTLEEYSELKGSGLGWMVYLRDTIQSGMSGREPRLREEDIQMLCGRKVALGLPAIADFARALNGEVMVWEPVTRVWDHLATLIRNFAVRRAGRGPSAEERDSPFEDSFIEDVYKQLDATKDCINVMQSLLAQFFAMRRPAYNFFMFYCRTMQLGYLFLVFLAHRAINQEIESLETPFSRAMLVPVDESGAFDSPEAEIRRAKLLAVKEESDRRMSEGARELAFILWTMQNSLTGRTGLGIMTGIHMIYETLQIWAETLCSLPTKDEGAAVDYTLDTKIQELGWLLSAYRSLGWSWPDMADTIAYVERQFEALNILRSSVPREASGGVPTSNAQFAGNIMSSLENPVPRPQIEFGPRADFQSAPNMAYTVGGTGVSPSTTPALPMGTPQQMPINLGRADADFLSIHNSSYNMGGPATMAPFSAPSVELDFDTVFHVVKNPSQTAGDESSSYSSSLSSPPQLGQPPATFVQGMDIYGPPDSAGNFLEELAPDAAAIGYDDLERWAATYCDINAPPFDILQTSTS